MQNLSTRTKCHPNNPCNGFYGPCLDVKITNRCNGHCSFCIERGGYQPEPAPVEHLINMTNALVKYQKVLILGGEPFLYPHLEQYIEGIRDKEEIYITTNGSLFRLEALERMARHLTAVNISIHHYDPGVNKEITGVTFDFKQIEQAVAILKRAGVSVRFNTNLIKGIHNHLVTQDMALLAQDIGADGIRFAELQGCPELYLSVREFIDVSDNPFVDGCEHIITDADGFQTTFRQTCGLCNSFLPTPNNPFRRGSMTKVLYPNGQVHDGWRSGSFSTWLSPFNDDCHGTRGCHTGGCH